MANFISEDDIERDIIKVFRNETLAYEYLNCYTTTAENLNDGSGRSDKKQVMLPIPSPNGKDDSFKA